MWREENNKLFKAFEFEDFSEAFAFIIRVGFLAESDNHHPQIFNDWNKVHVWLTTHDQGNIITDKDISMASRIDKLIKSGQ
ncbi:4a-hydroxytetrahydrobiopterin dehydratase [Mucilaginibacter gossypii]|uniref:4a-hydroxytetrahydrobiopterin dehydratase n=1 Tax=Mucilaginibacter gossypii TaxID=551996 RepID=UPI000DCCE06E|nr:MULTISPECIES: 4a-hydroxytetrahydrobiopterin dehydratase [Mucilaginibacter]QTE39745.1 4a-hydroxytetrahydrobiopterin dehydratase [Mucilaginibacter gossypii]RAV58355.1 pterin-4-alpha-carbinolamine dehydratase [Mucilaginibacter rubeus]